MLKNLFLENLQTSVEQETRFFLKYSPMNIISDRATLLRSLWRPAGHTPALRWQEIDISGHKVAHQISSSPEQPHMSGQLKNTPEAPNVWFTTLQISNLQPGSAGTSPTGHHLMALSHMKNCSKVLTTISWKYIILRAPAVTGTWFNFCCQLCESAHGFGQHHGN